MDSNSAEPADPESIEWDVLVIGAGMGGGTLGHALARAGKQVLFVERGKSTLATASDIFRDRYSEVDFTADMKANPAKLKSLLARSGRANEEIEDNSKKKPFSFVPFVGHGTGGSSSLYGMVCERLFPEDFTPRQLHRDLGDSTVPEEWPVTYEQMRPWYAQAEKLYRVRGTLDPLRPYDADAPLIAPPPMTPGNAELAEFLRTQGLHPYQLHMACEHRPECNTCQGFLCAYACKNDAARICVGPAVAEHGAKLLAECAVLRIEASKSRVEAVICHHKGRELRLRARTVVLAAGGLATPALLLHSRSAEWPKGLANSSGYVGANLMRHSIDMIVVGPKHVEGPITGQVKELSMNDFYIYEGQKFGTLQNAGPIPPLSVFVNQPGPEYKIFTYLKWILKPIYERLRTRGVVLAAIMEDLPYMDNRISPGAVASPTTGPSVQLTYRFHPNETARLKAFRELTKNMLKQYRPFTIRGAEDNKGIGHVCGTCRFGNDPKTSALDGDNRAHGIDNLYVVDGSFFPSSAGINPSLTIAANALRVADHLIARG